MSRRVMRGVAMMVMDAKCMLQRTPGGARNGHGLGGSAHISRRPQVIHLGRHSKARQLRAPAKTSHPALKLRHDRPVRLMASATRH